jgi:glutamine amidotransferase PdxT
VQVLGRLDEEPVLVGSGRILAATFHPEMSEPPTGGSPIHRRFLELCRQAAGTVPAPA